MPTAELRRRYLIAEAAERLRTSESTIGRLIKAGVIRAINVGTGQKRPRYVIDEAALEEFETRRSTAPLPVVPRRTRTRAAAVPNYF